MYLFLIINISLQLYFHILMCRWFIYFDFLSCVSSFSGPYFFATALKYIFLHWHSVVIIIVNTVLSQRGALQQCIRLCGSVKPALHQYTRHTVHKINGALFSMRAPDWNINSTRIRKTISYKHCKKVSILSNVH